MAVLCVFMYTFIPFSVFCFLQCSDTADSLDDSKGIWPIKQPCHLFPEVVLIQAKKAYGKGTG